MHGQSGCANSNTIRAGDDWLKAELPRIITWANANRRIRFVQPQLDAEVRRANSRASDSFQGLGRERGFGLTRGGAGARAARPLCDIAVENAVEGCVRETYGALAASWQAVKAADPEVRDAMRTIARDEVRHAALSFRLHRWLAPRLGAEDQARIRAEARRAIEDLRTAAASPSASELVRDAGVPDPFTGLSMMRALEDEVWRA
jgi:hypothetical protein